jgi:hypothetical protein
VQAGISNDHPGCIEVTGRSIVAPQLARYAQVMESRRPAVVPAEEAPAPVGPLDARAGLGPGSLLLDEVLLAPFLELEDLVLLSEAAKGLLPYRTQLIKVMITGYNSKLRDTLLRQRHLQAIRLGAPEHALQVMSLVREGVGRTLKSLQVDRFEAKLPTGKLRACATAGRHVGACLLVGGCPVLESLDFGGTSESVCAVVRGLMGCPRLLELRLNSMTIPSGEALAAALAEGTVPHLQQLGLVWDGEGVTSKPHAAAMARVLQASPRPKLRVLSITFTKSRELDDEGVVALVDALRADTYRSLTALEVFFKPARREQGLEALGEALAEGAWPRLESLDMQCTASTLGRVADAIQWGRLPRLQRLKLWYIYRKAIGGEVAVAVGGALRSGACPMLQTLEIYNGGAGCQEIARAMEEGHLPRLSVLKLPGARGVAWDGAQALAQALEGGAGANLIELELSLECVRSHTSLHAVVDKGACPKIRRSFISCKYY